MVPTQERLDAHHLTASGLDLGLVMQNERVRFETVAEFGDELETVGVEAFELGFVREDRHLGVLGRAARDC